MGIPVSRLEENNQDGSAPETGVHGAALEKSVEGMSAGVSESWAEAITSDIFHFVLVWQRRNGTLWVLLAELLVEEDEVSKPAADFHERFLEGCEVGLVYALATVIFDNF